MHRTICIALTVAALAVVACDATKTQSRSSADSAVAVASTTSAASSSAATVSQDSTASAPKPDTTASAHEPGIADAVAVIRNYYNAIDARQYRTAYALWSDNGKASGKSYNDFVNGFTDTSHVNADVGTPSRIDPAAGSRFITVPVTVTAQTRNGATQHFDGSYDLRYTVVDGATPAERTWHIYSAKIRAK